MSKMSDYLEEKLINHILRNSSFAMPSTIYIALFTDDPTDANVTANECSTSAASWTTYARQDASGGIGGPASGWNAPGSTDGTTENAKVITFPSNDGAPSVTVSHIGIYDQLTGGNLLFHAPLQSSKTLLQGDVLSFAAASITITFA